MQKVGCVEGGFAVSCRRNGETSSSKATGFRFEGEGVDGWKGGGRVEKLQGGRTDAGGRRRYRDRSE